MLLYLNPGWKPSWGGALRIFREGGEHVDVPPEAGTLVLMRSDAVEHEVLETAAPRHCVVGWFRQERCGVLTPT